MTHQFNPTILREYDIRGIVGDTLTEADAYALGRTYAALARDEGARRIAVGRDGRTHSGMLEAALVRGLTEGGIDAVLIGMGPSPMLYFATYYLDVDGGIQVTGQPQSGRLQRVQAAAEGPLGVRRRRSRASASARRRATGAKATAPPKRSTSAKPMSNRLLEGFSGKAFRIGWDAGNGAAGPILDMLVERLPGQHHASSPTSTGPSPTTIPTRRSRRISQT